MVRVSIGGAAYRDDFSRDCRGWSLVGMAVWGDEVQWGGNSGMVRYEF